MCIRDRILSRERSMGSVIKLLTPSSRDYNDAYNTWLRAIPQHIKELVFVIKRFHRAEWGDDWRSHYSVDLINGRPGYALKLNGSTLIVNTLRVGFEKDGAWRVFGLRHDFHPAIKVQTEDDITASVVAPVGPDALSRKFVPVSYTHLDVYKRQPSVVRKIFGRSADLRPCKCSWVDQEKVCNPLGLKAFCLWRNSRRIHFDTSEFFAGNVKTELLRD